MSEPVEVADVAEEIVPGVWHWRIANSAIGGATSSSHLVASPEGAVLIDPVRLADDELERLPRPTAILLTSKGHQRAAWRYRRALGAPVWAPAGTPEPDEAPDHRYETGDALPGGFRPILTPGPAAVHHCLLRSASPAVLVCSDLLMGEPGSGLRYGPLQYHDDPAATKRSVEQLLELSFDVLLLDHGQPFEDGKSAIRKLVADDASTA